MKNSELIAKLQEFDGDLEVAVAYGFGFERVVSAEVVSEIYEHGNEERGSFTVVVLG